MEILKKSNPIFLIIFVKSNKNFYNMIVSYQLQSKSQNKK